MKKYIAVILFFFSSAAFSKAEVLDFPTYFQNKNGCFIVFDLNENKMVSQYNPKRCAQKVPPNSTFKIALALMAFDQKLITPESTFKWDGKDKGLSAWNQDQNVKTWFSNSAVWVSQELTLQLGEEKIKNYLREFNYGNQDFSGDAGKDNGLTNAWLSSSLKISADEQLTFLKNLIAETLPVSKEALADTQDIMYIETSPKGWGLYGKTASGRAEKSQFREGWFIGLVQKPAQGKAKQTYIVILNFTDKKTMDTSVSAGQEAKTLSTLLLKKLALL